MGHNLTLLPQSDEAESILGFYLMLCWSTAFLWNWLLVHPLGALPAEQWYLENSPGPFPFFSCWCFPTKFSTAMWVSAVYCILGGLHRPGTGEGRGAGGGLRVRVGSGGAGNGRPAPFLASSLCTLIHHTLQPPPLPHTGPQPPAARSQAGLRVQAPNTPSAPCSSEPGFMEFGLGA